MTARSFCVRVTTVIAPAVLLGACNPGFTKQPMAKLAPTTIMGEASDSSAQAEPHTLVVDQKRAGETQNGTMAHPFRTIAQAAAVAKPGDSVSVHAGIYRETITPAHSGQPGAPITYKPFPGEKVVISGTELVTGWKATQGKIYAAPLSSEFYHSSINYSDQIFIDGQMLNIARWPNTSLDVSSPKKSTLTKFISKTRDNATNWTTSVFEDDSLPANASMVGAEIFLQPNKDAWSWAFSGTVIAQQGKQLTIKTRSDAGQDGNPTVYAVGSRYYLYNKKELLDAPSEWWHDTNAGLIYLQTPDGQSPVKHSVEARARDYAFNLDGLSHITIQGFSLFACTITTDAQAGNGVEYDAAGHDLYPWRKGDSLPVSHDIVLDGLDARYVSEFTDRSGHFFLQWGLNTGINISGTNQTIQNCHIQFSAGNGIVSYGRGNHILNNLIEDVAYSAIDDAGISTIGGAGAYDFEIAYNTIRRTGRSGLILRGLQNSDATKLVTRVHHNDVSSFMLQDFDGGATYTFGQDAKFARVDHNWFHDASGANVSGFYIDYAKNWIVDHNVIWNVDWAIHLEGTHQSGVVDTLVYNNTALSRSAAVGVGNGQASGSIYENNIFNHPLGKVQQGAQAIRNNLTWDNTPGSATDPRFVNANENDYRLQNASAAHNIAASLGSVTMQQPGNPDITVLPPDAAGHNGKLDAGAYAQGEPLWTAGSTLKAGLKAPAEPGSLATKATSASQINLVWADNSSNESGFVIERKSGGQPFKQIAVAGANTTEFYDAGVSRSTSYTYRVQATNSAGGSAYSEVSTAATPARTITDAVIGQTQTPPSLGGQDDAVWQNVAALPLSHINSGALTSESDLSGTWKATWDNKNLYIRVDVRDNMLVKPNEKLPWYSADGVELYLDADNSKKSDYDHVNDFQIAFPWGAEKAAFGQSSVQNDTGFRFNMTTQSGGYRLETALPWSTLLGYTPKPGAVIGFDIQLSDNDDGVNGKGKRAWHTTINESWMHPNLFGTVELDGAAH